MTSSIVALFFLRNPCSACVGLPSALYAAFAGGPLTSSSRSASRSAMFGRYTISRRGVLLTMGELPRTCANCCRSVACAASCIHAGISSSSSSKRYSAMILCSGGRSRPPAAGARSGCRYTQQREPQRFARLEVLLRARHRQLAHALDHADALCHRDRAARVESVEHVRALQRPVVRRQHQLFRQAPLRLGLVCVEQLPVQRDVRDFEVVLRELVFVL